MEISTQYLLLSALYVECLVGFTVNMMIVVANVMKWKSRTSPQTSDKILSYLAISRGLYFVSIILRNSLFHFFPWLLHHYIALPILYIQAMFLFYSSHWIVTILCVFYWVRSVTYNCRLCIFLRTRISSMVPWLIPASLVISLTSSLPYGWYGYDYKLQNISNSSIDYGIVVTANYENRLVIFTVGSFPPFVIFCVANFSLVQFLLIHTRRMSSVVSPNLKIHYGAVKSMSLFLVLQIMFFISTSLFTSGQFLHSINFPISIRWIILGFPPLFHSLYIFFSRIELRKLLIIKCPSVIRCACLSITCCLD